MTVAELPIRFDPEKLAAFCRARGISKLSLFGSVLREDFEPGRSDVDVLIDLPEGTRVGLEYFGWAEELGRLLGQRVDLCSRLNPHLAKRVCREALILYEQA